jgi:hypothetical protein
LMSGQRLWMWRRTVLLGLRWSRCGRMGGAKMCSPWVMWTQTQIEASMRSVGGTGLGVAV